MVKIPLIAVVGPTASGKTDLAVELAKRFDGEIVSADSMQLYKYMDIGTAKPDKSEMRGIRHYMIDEFEPSVKFSVAQYADLAHGYIAKIHDTGKIPIIVGGTGLYVQSVIDDVEFKEEEIDLDYRAELERLADENGGEYLINMLGEFDAVSAQRLHPNNVRRIIRAIEFYKATGIPISQHQQDTKIAPSRYSPLLLGIDWDRDILYDRINRRVDVMVERGLFDEVKRLLDMGCTRADTAMQGIGYKEIINYMRGFCSYDEAVYFIKRNSRRYAKRQLTWFKRDKRVRWLAGGADIADRAAAEAEKTFFGR